MDKITIDKACKKCGRSSTYIKKTIKGENYFVCSQCGFKLCKEHEVMSVAFPMEQKPYSSKAKNYGYVSNNTKSKKKN